MRLFNYYNCNGNVLVEGYEHSPGTGFDSHSSEGLNNKLGSRYNWISPAYFHTFEIPLIAGRDFTRSDAIGSPNVAIVNEAFAGHFKLGRDIIGKHMGFEGGPAQYRNYRTR